MSISRAVLQDTDHERQDDDQEMLFHGDKPITRRSDWPWLGDRRGVPDRLTALQKGARLPATVRPCPRRRSSRSAPSAGSSTAPTPSCAPTAGFRLFTQTRRLPEEALADFPPASELECVRVAPVAWMEALARGLQERGVTLRVERALAEDAPEGQRADIFGDIAQLFGLYVRSEDLELARELDASIAAQLVPEESEALEEGEMERLSGLRCGAVCRCARMRRLRVEPGLRRREGSRPLVK